VDDECGATRLRIMSGKSPIVGDCVEPLVALKLQNQFSRLSAAFIELLAPKCRQSTFKTNRDSSLTVLRFSVFMH
jgi:hypothetical protein